MPIKYEWKLNFHGDEIQSCECCHIEAPIHCFKLRHGNKWLCEICATTYIGGMLISWREDEHKDIEKTIAAVANIVLYKLGAFGEKPEIE